MCASTPRMYPRSGYFLLHIYFLVFIFLNIRVNKTAARAPEQVSHLSHSPQTVGHSKSTSVLFKVLYSPSQQLCPENMEHSLSDVAGKTISASNGDGHTPKNQKKSTRYRKFYLVFYMYEICRRMFLINSLVRNSVVFKVC